MKKKIIVIVFIALLLGGCRSFSNITNDREPKEIYIPENYKLVFGKTFSSGLNCFYRPMRNDEEPEVYFVQENRFGESFELRPWFIIYETKNGVRAKLPDEK